MIGRPMEKIIAGITSLFLVTVVFSFIPCFPWYVVYYLFLPISMDRIKLSLFDITLQYPLSIIALTIISSILVTTPYILYEKVKGAEVLYRDSPIPILAISLVFFWFHRILEFYLTWTLFWYYIPFFSELPLRISLFLVISFFGWVFWLTLTRFFCI